MNHITTKFERLCAAHGLEDGDVIKEIGETFYDAGISAALQQSNCKEAVLTHGYTSKHNPLFLEVNRLKGNAPVLTQAQVQSLSAMMRNTLREIEELRPQVKGIIRNAWANCDPENPETSVDFSVMNEYKDSLRMLRAKHKSLSEIQRTLKKMQKVA